MAVGNGALPFNTTGSNNTAIGSAAGRIFAPGNNNVYVGSEVSAFPGENNTIHIGDNLPNTQGASACFIGGIWSQIAVSGATVFVNSQGRLGTQPSSKRFKDDIKPMGNASESILALQPVTFHYTDQLDPSGRRQFGLVA